MSSSPSPLVLLTSLAALGTFGYSVYFMKTDSGIQKMNDFVPELKKYGALKYLTYQCLLIQLTNSILHVGAYFFKSLRGPRDLVFSALAYPIGSIVVYSFWSVWHLMGRELIFPVQVEQVYPNWLNHATHTIIAPLNIILAILVNHKYTKHGLTISVGFMICYTAWLHYIKYDSGLFVYKYLDKMNNIERVIYFVSTAVANFVLYKSGQMLTNLVHKQPTQRPALKKTKQK